MQRCVVPAGESPVLSEVQGPALSQIEGPAPVYWSRETERRFRNQKVMKMNRTLQLVGIMCIVAAASLPARGGYVDGMSLYEYVRSGPMVSTDAPGLKSRTLAKEEDVTMGPKKANDACDLELRESSKGFCILFVDMKLEFTFSGKWAYREKYQFMSDYADAVSEAWSRKHKISLYGAANPDCCPCKKGIDVSIRLTTWVDKGSVSEHWEVKVNTKDKFRSYTSRFWGETRTNKWGVQHATHDREYRQRPVVHEFGVQIGLELEYAPRGKRGPGPYTETNVELMTKDGDSVMDRGERIYQRHYRPFVDWVNKKIKQPKSGGPCKYGFK